MTVMPVTVTVPGSDLKVAACTHSRSYKLNDLHLIGILDYNEERGIKSKFDQFIEKEIEYRKEHNIKIEDGAYHWEDGIHNKDNFD